jgi:murein DD-endopeptidase MepM/ murein hydrolase activator NlpD
MTRREFIKNAGQTAAFTACLVLAAAAGAGGARPDMQTIFIPGIPVELVFRALQPGEVLLAEMKDSPSVRRISIRLGGRKYELDHSTGNRPGVLIGLDLGLKSGPLIMDIAEEKTDGAVEHYSEALEVAPREFSKRYFRVDEKMLAPPPAEQERVKREQDLLQAVYGVITPDWLGTGPFIPPLAQEPFPNFGQNRVYNKSVSSVHAGVDIAAPYGTPIRASNSGNVVLASDFYLTGKTVILDHGCGVFSLYFHCSKLLVKRGDRVRRGEFIAKVGNTGRSTGPHLHWGIRIYDSRVDPFSLVALPLE